MTGYAASADGRRFLRVQPVPEQPVNRIDVVLTLVRGSNRAMSLSPA